MTKLELQMVEIISMVVLTMNDYRFKTSALREMIYGNANKKEFDEAIKEMEAFLNCFENNYY